MSNAKEIYHVIVHRKAAVPSAIQLNFTDREQANHAFAEIRRLPSREELGSKVIVDSYGGKFDLDPADIGHVVLIETSRALEMQADLQIMQAVTQRHAQARLDAMPMVTARPGLIANG